MIDNNLFKINNLKNIVLLGAAKYFDEIIKINKNLKLNTEIISCSDQIKEFNLKKNTIKFDKLDNNFKNYLSKKYDFDKTLFISLGARWIFGKDTINNFFKNKLINFHGTRLPYDSGGGGHSWKIIRNDRIDNQLVHIVDEGIDTGDIILQKSFQITDQDNYKTLLEKAYVECSNILYESILMFKKGSVKAYKQNKIHPVGFYCGERKKGDEVLNWNQTSREVFNFVRAICRPGPCARTFINKKEMKINKVELLEKTPNYKSIVGLVVNKNLLNFTVITKDSFIKITEFEFDGKLKIGDRFEV